MTSDPCLLIDLRSMFKVPPRARPARRPLTPEQRALAERHLHCVFAGVWAMRRAFPDVPAAEHIAVASLRYCQAIPRYDPNNAKISTYVYRHVFRAGLDARRARLSYFSGVGSIRLADLPAVGRFDDEIQSEGRRDKHGWVSNRVGTAKDHVIQDAYSRLDDEDSPRVAWLRRAISRLASPLQREVMVRLSGGQAVPEIAVAMGTTRGAVCWHRGQAIRNLRAMAEDDDEIFVADEPQRRSA